MAGNTSIFVEYCKKLFIQHVHKILQKKHFLPPDTLTYVCVSGYKKCQFSENFADVLNGCSLIIFFLYLESEAILAKYRNLTLDSSNTSGLSDSFVNSSTMELTSSNKQEEVTFDEEYKFNDAKRKLRTVLCSCDRISLPQ